MAFITVSNVSKICLKLFVCVCVCVFFFFFFFNLTKIYIYLPESELLAMSHVPYRFVIAVIEFDLFQTICFFCYGPLILYDF